MAITYVKLQPCQSNNSEAALSSDRLSSCNDNGSRTSEVFILAATGMCRDFTRAMILCLMAMHKQLYGSSQSIYRYVRVQYVYVYTFLQAAHSLTITLNVHYTYTPYNVLII